MVKIVNEDPTANLTVTETIQATKETTLTPGEELIQDPNTISVKIKVQTA
jgi:hypothetical protein